MQVHYAGAFTDNRSATADEEKTAHVVRHLSFASVKNGRIVSFRGMVCSWQNQSRCGQEHNRGRVGGSCGLEGRLRTLKTGSEEGAAEDEKDVGEDAAKHAGLDNAEFTLVEGDDAHNG